MSDQKTPAWAVAEADALAARSVNCEPPGALAEKLAEKRPLRVKLGVDPTAPDIHLGHTVVLQKLREFQDAGHTAVLIIGDWTARVGDPSGRSSTRPMLSPDEIDRNAETFRRQADLVLDPERTEVRSNGEWFAGMTLADVLALTSHVTVNQLLRRNDFATRMADDRPISMLELVYPLMQGYDSVMVEADVELGGTDQLFNLMLGRALQARMGCPVTQVSLTMPLLVGTDGVQKMSKSLGNYIGVTEPPEEQFGKAMSVPDATMAEYYRLLVPAEPGPTGHPAAEKRRLGRLIADRFHGPGAGEAAEEHFNRVTRDHKAPDDVPEHVLGPDDPVHLPALMVAALGLPSNGEARRLIQQGAVSLDGVPVADLDVARERLSGAVLKAGKRRFARLVAGD